MRIFVKNFLLTTKMTSIFLGSYRAALVEKNDIILMRLTDGKSIVLSKQDINMLIKVAGRHFSFYFGLSQASCFPLFPLFVLS